MMLVFGAVLVWREPRQSRNALLMMIFLNALWTLTDLVYIPLLQLSAWDFYAKLVVNAVLAIGLAVAGRRAGVIWPDQAFDVCPQYPSSFLIRSNNE